MNNSLLKVSTCVVLFDGHTIGGLLTKAYWQTSFLDWYM